MSTSTNVGLEEPRNPVLQLADIVNRQFVLVPGQKSARQAREMIDALSPTRVIVQRSDEDGTGYYLLPLGESLSLFAAAGDVTAGEALSAVHTFLVPALDASTRFDEASDHCVVLEEGELIGFYDVDVDVPDIQRGREPEGLEPDLVPRLLAAEIEEEVELGQTVSLLISLATSPERVGDALPLALALGAEVDVYVRPKRGFELNGPREARLVVTEETETLPVQFRLRAVTLGEARIEVLVFHLGSCLGRLVLSPVITQGSLGKRSTARYERELDTGSALNPDLALIIFETGDHRRPELLIRLCSVESSMSVKPFGPISLRLDPSRYFDDFFRDMEGLGGGDDKACKAATERLHRKGAELFQTLFPRDLQELLWSFRRRIRSLRIESEEPWIPWELCRLVGRERGKIVESGFFCEKFVMARWILGVKRKPGLRLRRIGVIAPASSGLSGAQEERCNLLGIQKESFQVEPISPRYLEVIKALASGTYDGLHFAGHALYRNPDPNRSYLLLDDQHSLSPEDLSGKVSNLGRLWPLVFLNACQTGRNSFSLTDLGGWAPKFLKAGAAAFLGSLWEVSDRGAEIFARTFYGELLSGQPIGEAVRQARITVRKELPGNPSWLAYTLFAEPLARVVDAPHVASG